MDTSLYKTHTTTRSFKYSYFYSPPSASKATVLLLHGFPSTANDWRHVVPSLRSAGYGLIVPDMLGYGNTSRPTTAESYRMKGIVVDLLELLDVESVQQAVVIGHDRGAAVAARLYNHFPSRVLAIGFVTVSYHPPDPDMDVDTINQMTKAALGYEIFGYQKFFSQAGVAALIEENIDSFLSLCFPDDPALWRTDLAPLGALEAWLKGAKRAVRAPYITTSELKSTKNALLKDGGLAAPLCWYQVATGRLKADDDRALVQAGTVKITIPAFFGACTKDYVCLAERGKAQFSSNVEKGTIKEYEADHWVILSHGKELSRDLLDWLKEVGL